MKVEIAEAKFRPVTITLETEDDFDQLEAILFVVANQKINYRHSLISAAAEMRARIYRALVDAGVED